MTGPLLVGALTFLLLLPWGDWTVRALLARGIGKQIRSDEPASHQSKSGTATMGGLYFLAGITVMTIILTLVTGATGCGVAAWIAMLGYGLLGAFDDWRGLVDTDGVGWLARHKFPAQWGTAIVLALVVYWLAPDGRVLLWNIQSEVGGAVALILLTTFLIVFFSNAVNLTDGLDGLAGGTAAIAFLAYGALATSVGDRGLALFCLTVVGALIAFLWFNAHPARIFMGDVGSQALGAGLAVVGVLSGHWVLLPFIGVVFMAEALSVMLQVSYFKYTRRKYGEGRRILRMSPLHYHYELGGWSEVQIVTRAWLVTAVAAAIGVALGTTFLPPGGAL